MPDSLDTDNPTDPDMQTRQAGPDAIWDSPGGADSAAQAPSDDPSGDPGYQAALEAASASGPGAKQVRDAANEVSESLIAYRFAEAVRLANGDSLWRCLSDDWRTCRRWRKGKGWLSGADARTASVNELDGLIVGICAEHDSSAGRWAAMAKVRASLSLAAAYPGILTPPEQWNADADYLGLPGARKVNLETGRVEDMHAADLIDMRAAVEPDAACPIPNFLQVVDHMSGGDEELRNFYKLALGYSLFGHNREEIAFFWYGEGNSGKTSLLQAVKRTLGDYGGDMNRETLEGDARQHLTFLNKLRGKRIAVTGELEGEPLNAARFKSLTGGDPIEANAMRQDPELLHFQAVIHGMANPDCLPSLRRVGEDIRRRICIIPAGEEVPKPKRDIAVKAAMLGKEQPGILQWLIDGAVEYSALEQDQRRSGLARPAAVHAVTERYFADASPVARWVHERCRRDGEAGATELYADFGLWWRDMRLKGSPVSLTEFGRTLTGLGFGKRSSNGIKRTGISLQ